MNKVSQGINDIGQLTNAVQEWLGGQRDILFMGLSISSPSDMSIYQRLCVYARGFQLENPTLSDIIYSLMAMQARLIDTLPESKVNHLIYYGVEPYDVVQVKCFTCDQPLPADTLARWAVKR
jgi:hypothetical protein